MNPLEFYCSTCHAEPGHACDPRIAPLGPIAYLFHDDRAECAAESVAEARAERPMNKK